MIIGNQCTPDQESGWGKGKEEEANHKEVGASKEEGGIDFREDWRFGIRESEPIETVRDFYFKSISVICQSNF